MIHFSFGQGGKSGPSVGGHLPRETAPAHFADKVVRFTPRRTAAPDAPPPSCSHAVRSECDPAPASAKVTGSVRTGWWFPTRSSQCSKSASTCVQRICERNATPELEYLRCEGVAAEEQSERRSGG